MPPNNNINYSLSESLYDNDSEICPLIPIGRFVNFEPDGTDIINVNNIMTITGNDGFYARNYVSNAESIKSIGSATGA